MILTDPIADFLTRLKNATLARKHFVQANHSNINEKIAKILLEQGYIKDYKVGSNEKNFKQLEVELKFAGNCYAFSNIKRVSKPGLRVYSSVDKIPKVINGLGTAILSTSKGVMTGKQAIKNGVGGEVLAFIW